MSTIRFYIPGFLIGLAAMLTPSCTLPAKKDGPGGNTPEKKDSVVILPKPPSGFSDTLTIRFPSAVFYNPDSVQRQKMKETYSKNEYETEVHNCFYLMRNARNVLKQHWPKIQIVETSAYRYLLFAKADKTSTLVDLDTKGDICGIFLFDGNKDPEPADMMNIDTALGFYFGH